MGVSYVDLSGNEILTDTSSPVLTRLTLALVSSTSSRSLSTKLWYFYLPLIFLCAPNFSLNHSAPLRCWCFWPLLEMWHSYASSSGSRVFNNNSLMHFLCLVHQCFRWLISSFSCLKHCNLPNTLMLSQVGIWIFPPPRELVCVIGLNGCRVQLM